MNEVLLQFLRTGELGPLKCGLPREDVRRLLGDPQSWDGGESDAVNWRYEALSVEFEMHQVVGYGLGFNLRQPLPICISGLACPAYVEMSMELVCEELTSAMIAFEERRGGQRNIRSNGGVWVFADSEERLMSMVFVCPGQNALQRLDEQFPKPLKTQFG